MLRAEEIIHVEKREEICILGAEENIHIRSRIFSHVSREYSCLETSYCSCFNEVLNHGNYEKKRAR